MQVLEGLRVTRPVLISGWETVVMVCPALLLHAVSRLDLACRAETGPETGLTAIGDDQ